MQSSHEIESPATLKTATSRHLSLLESPFRMKNPDILPVTNGMTETQLSLLAMSPTRKTSYGGFSGLNSPGLRSKKRRTLGVKA